jgi:DNA uptake protein ComE-like DNA-binding protein
MRNKSPGLWVSLTRSEYAGAFFMLIIAVVLALLPSLLGTNKQNAIVYLTDSIQRATLISKHIAATDSFFKKKRSRLTQWKGLKQQDLENLGLSADEANRVYQKLRLGYQYSSLSELSKETGIDTTVLKNAIAKPAFRSNKSKTSMMVELNSCDTSDLIALPGIGSKTAARIIRFRDALGGFYQKEQILETRYTDTAVLEKLLPSFQINNALLRKIPIQSADLELLKKHPYLSEKQARVIIAFRNQHGRLTEQHLKEIRIISDADLKRLMPYLDFNE